MLDMGFIGSVRKIAGMTGQERQTLLFSATMPREIEQLAQELLRDPVSIRIAPVTEPVDTVKQSLCYTVKAEKKHILAVLLSREGVKKSIVFTRTKHGADKLARDLEKAGIHALSIHGDKTQGQRQNALERFKSGNIRVLIATDLASRGIDVPKLSHVFNYELPEDPEFYIHRIGRSGRAGAVGEAVSLCCEEELERLYDIERMMKRELPLLEIAGSIPLVRLSKGGNAAGKKPEWRRRQRDSRERALRRERYRQSADGVDQRGRNPAGRPGEELQKRPKGLEAQKLLIQFRIDPFAEPWLGGVADGFLPGEPGDSGILIRFTADRFRGICLEKIGEIQVQVRGDILSALFMPVYGEDFQRENLRREETERPEPALLAYLLLRDEPEIMLAVRMSSEPGPGAVEIMICHENPAVGGVGNPCGSGEVCNGIFPREGIRQCFQIQIGKQSLPISFLLRVAGQVCLQLFDQLFHAFPCPFCFLMRADQS